MTKIAILFPGQGSQKVGMGLDLYDTPSSKTLFDRANQQLGYSLSTLCFEGPMEALTETQHAQPAIFLVSMALFQLLSEAGIKPAFVAGHSLGELTAYAASGVLSFESALALILKRGAAMASACPSGTASMAAVMGLSPETIQNVIAPFSSSPLVIANYNCPGQIVISGTSSALEHAIPLLKEAGGKVIPLPVSGAFHSPLMQPASEALSQCVSDFSFTHASAPIVLNRTAALESDALALTENVVKQVVSPVRFIEMIDTLVPLVDCFIECGPGKVLAGLYKKMGHEKPFYSVSSLETLAELKTHF